MAGLLLARQKTEMEAAFDQPPALTAEGEEKSAPEKPTTTHTDFVPPKDPRWAIAHPDTDLTGTWRPVVTAEFLEEYNRYLANCGTTFLFRQVCLKFCGTTRESITQIDKGRILRFQGSAPVGGWNRSLVASGSDSQSDEFDVYHAEFLDPDKELVRVEAWWIDEGRVHKSILRDKAGVDGGEFETLRYLTRNESDQLVLVTESTFRPSAKHLNSSSSKFKPAFVRWNHVKEEA